MSIDIALFQQRLQNVSTDEDAANLLFEFVEQPLIWVKTKAGYIAVVHEIPPILRCLYFAIYMDIGVSGEGFPQFFAWLPYRGSRKDIIRGLELIGDMKMAEIFREAMAYLRPFGRVKASEMSFYEMDKHTDNIHGKYFQQNDNLRKRVGRYMRHHPEALFEIEEA